VLLQNAGSVCHLSAEYRISLRSSPIICAADTILCFVKFIWLSTISDSTITVLRHVWYDRFENDDIQAGSGIDNMWRLNMVAFVLGALPQAVKVFSMKGILGTQALISIFLATFLVQEVLRITAGTPHAIELSPVNITQNITQRFARFENVLVIAACVIQAACWVWAISHILPSHWFITILEWKAQHELSDLCWVIWLSSMLMLVITGHMLVGLVFIYSVDLFPGLPRRIYVRVVKAPRKAWIVIGLFCMLLIGLDFYLWQVFIPVFTAVPVSELSVERIANVVKLVVSAISLLAFILISHVLYCIIFMGKFSMRLRELFGLRGSILEFLSLGFLILNFCTLFIYYSSIYSSENTYKPAWTDKLG